MAMAKETKSEIVIVVVIAAFFFLLWWMNRANGAGSGLTGQVAIPDSTGTNALAPLFNVVPNVESGGVNFGAPQFNIGGATMDVSNAGACNCGPATTWLNAGSPGDMATWLASLPNYLQTAQDGLTNWN